MEKMAGINYEKLYKFRYRVVNVRIKKCILLLAVSCFMPSVCLCGLSVTGVQIGQIDAESQEMNAKWQAYLEKVKAYKCVATSSGQEEEIKKLFRTREANRRIVGAMLEKAVRCYITNNHVSRMHKLNYFWDLMMDYQANPAKRAVAAYFLGDMRPVEISSKIAHFCENNPGSKCASILLYSIARTKEGLKVLEKNINSSDPSKIEKALFRYVALLRIAPKDKCAMIQHAFNRIKKLAPEYLDSYFNYATYYNCLIYIALKEDQSILSQLLKQINTSPQYLKNIFNKVLCSSLINTQPKTLTGNSRKLLQLYLKGQEGEAENMDFGIRMHNASGKSISNTIGFMRHFPLGRAKNCWAWLHAYAIIFVESGPRQYVEQAEYMANYILDINDLEWQANILGVADRSVIQSIPIRQLKILRAKFFLKKETDRSLTRRNRMSVMRALTKINRVLQAVKKSGGVRSRNFSGLILKARIISRRKSASSS